MASLSWRNKYIYNGKVVHASPEAVKYGVLVLSPVRTNTQNTCLYRSLCYACDARARIRTRSSPFAGRFSLERIKRLERKWLSRKLRPLPRKVRHCLDYFAAKDGPALPMEPEDGTISFKIRSYEMEQNTGAASITLVKKALLTGPVIGCLRLRLDYFNETDGVYWGVGQLLSADNIDQVCKPPRVEDPVRKTPTPPPLTPSPPEHDAQDTLMEMEEEKQPEKYEQDMCEDEEVKEEKQPEKYEQDMCEDEEVKEEKKEEDEVPDQRKTENIKAHAVCIVGYCIAKDKEGNPKECFVVQDSFGSKFRDGGFSLIPTKLFQRFFFVRLKHH
ncbi:hypothetical protein LINGRAHAP2_LOCUS6267 [Linum grandiflorum]